jgi:hypothetical protein
MPIWKLASVDDEPEIALSRWRILESEAGIRHFVGTDDLDTGWVSPAIIAFDRQILRAKTLSGRVYQLAGEAGWSGGAD